MIATKSAKLLILSMHVSRNSDYGQEIPQSRLKRLNLPTLHYRRKRYDLIQLYMIVHGFDEIEPGKLVDFNDNCTRSHLFKVQKPSCKKKLRLDSFPIRCIDRWNSQSKEKVSSDTVLNFKTKLDKFYMPDRYNRSKIH